MGVIADGIRDYKMSHNEALNYFVGAVAAAVFSNGSTRDEKLMDVREMVKEFNAAFPSAVISHTIKEGE